MRGAQRGFTLIETMVAIMLMAIVSLIAWRGLDSVSRADQHLRASAEHTETLLRVLNQLERDLSLHASTELGVPNLTRYSEPARRLPTITLRGAHPQRFRLDVIRSAAQPEQGLQRVRWWLAGQTLYRAAAPARSHYPLPPPDQGVAVLDEVSDVQVRVWEPGQGWHPLNGTRQDDPVGVEITLTRQAAQGPEHYRHVIGPLNE
ncbi:prepilin-type N-terminal cleavage/methylation domain-containing protein [Pseudomonas sp. S75]|uniref:type II secretion system protein GspJ n=1 Tax=unclassified Pseudomonas TaxID=196821 RepID=UPI001905B26F|nr:MULTISPECIES: type II secretion system protein GspJ [unclassified Pseudomonas]MBJ9975512.1 prepilin-type N-terminal cleavage/methylation domain-containing protein [Pseudomonas sp. S30]MBK0153063.1 prepilin-type N-terminal cleavage/methylation domain-containing protein [Pseudomonas sp. S75]